MKKIENIERLNVVEKAIGYVGVKDMNNNYFTLGGMVGFEDKINELIDAVTKLQKIQKKDI